MNVFVVTIQVCSWRWTRRFVPLAVFACVLASSDAARAIDYRISGSTVVAAAGSEGYSVSGHCRPGFIDIRTLPFGICAGVKGCCCVDDTEACTPMTVSQDQKCDKPVTLENPGCAACCHQRDRSERADPSNHQSCCSSGTDCCPDTPAPACATGLKSVKLVRNADCPTTNSDNVLMTYCDDATSQPCSDAAPGRFEATVCDVPASALDDLDAGLLNLCIEFENDVIILADFTHDARKIPVLSGWGAVAMAAVLLVAGGILLRRRRLVGVTG